MTTRTTQNKNVRNLQKNQSTYYVTLPVEMVKELDWKERQKVVVQKVGKTLVIKDWKK